MRKLFYYNKNQFFNFKRQQMACGGELLSMSQFLSSRKINDLDEDVNYYVDLSMKLWKLKNELLKKHKCNK